MLDGKNSLSLEKKKRERTIFCAGFILRNLFYLFERGRGKREREKGKNRALSDQKYTRRMKIQREQRIDEIKIPVQCD